MKQARIGAVLKQVQTVLKRVGLRYIISKEGYKLTLGLTKQKGGTQLAQHQN